MWLHQGDAFEWLRGLEDECADCFITDYPYESLEKHRKVGTTTRLKNSKSSSNEWFGTVPNSMTEELLYQAFRVLKNNRHAYFFCDDETSDVLKASFEKVKQRFKDEGTKVKLKCWKRIVWQKLAIGMGYHYRAQYEFILFFEKGKRKLNNLGIPDVLKKDGVLTADEVCLVSRQSDVLEKKRIRSKTAYPTEKPHELIQVLIENSCKGGELIIDPFMGSGSTGEATMRADLETPPHGKIFWGNDISTVSLKYAINRLEEWTREAE